ncbi:MAG: HD-GYP domain-containing protein [Cellulosilyticaceae bacterium]
MKTQFELVKNFMCFQVEEVLKITTDILNNVSQKNIIFDILDLKRNDNYTYSHCLNVALFSCAIGRKLGVSHDILEQIVTGALLHDIGKMVIPKDILNKSGKLTVSERSVIEGHSQLGYEFIKNTELVTPIIKTIVLCHHEREDCSGYPLSTNKISNTTAIVAVADVFDALISDRPYRVGFPINTALSILKQEHLNKNIVDALESIVNFYPVGCAVMLNNGLVGIVEKNFAENLSKPLVRIVFNTLSSTKTHARCDLRTEKFVSIVSRVDLSSPTLTTLLK